MPTLHEALLTFLQVDRSPLTNQQYRMVLTKLVTAIGPQRDIALIRYEDLVDYFAQLQRTNIRQSTLSGYLSVTKSFFNWATERRYIERSPAADVRVRKPRRDPARLKAIPPDELKALVEYARITSPRNHALLLFLADTGCRAGGLASLTRMNLQIEEGWAMLIEKGDSPYRALFGEETAAALSKWLSRRPAADHDYVWTGQGPHYAPLTTGGVAAIIRRLCERTGASRLWGPHSIRHAVGHAYAKAGVPVTVTQRKLGHRSPKVTMEYYYPEDDEYLAQVSRRNALAALRTENDLQPQPLRVLKPEDEKDRLKNSS